MDKGIPKNEFGQMGIGTRAWRAKRMWGRSDLMSMLGDEELLSQSSSNGNI